MFRYEDFPMTWRAQFTSQAHVSTEEFAAMAHTKDGALSKILSLFDQTIFREKKERTCGRKLYGGSWGGMVGQLESKHVVYYILHIHVA